jgi:hypothetical protein
MAVPTIILDFPKPSRLGNTAMGVLSGQMEAESYDTAHPAVASITGKFLAGGKLRVMCAPVTENGYFVAWDHVTSSFKAYTTAGTVPVEVANTTDIGFFDFIAVGQLG